jgi:hypothetical protein
VRINLVTVIKHSLGQSLVVGGPVSRYNKNISGFAWFFPACFDAQRNSDVITIVLK